MSEDAEQGSHREGANGTPLLPGSTPNAISRSSSASSQLGISSGSVPSEERNTPVVRPFTPPPSRGMSEDNLFESKYGDKIAPPSPSGVRWRPAGATFDPYPNTLIDDRDKVRLEKLGNLPRLIDRNRAFHQSSNKVHLGHNQGLNIYRLLRFNWFHVFLRWPTKYSFLILVSVWTGALLVFATLYVLHDQLHRGSHCVLGGLNGEVIDFAGAFAFALETTATNGYGLPNSVNSYFEKDCSALRAIVYFQVTWSLLVNTFFITFVYNRLGRSETRSVQVIFSNKALVSVVDGQARLQVRIFDSDSRHPVVEAHIRMYGVMKQRPVPRPLRTLQPDDQLGGMLFLSFPTVVSHSIDMYSLLHPPVMSMSLKPKGMVLRQADGFTANRNDIVCPICGKSYGTFARWLNHVQYQQSSERQNGFPVADTHLSLDLMEIEKEPHSKPIKDIDTLKEYFKENVSEILCLVEGIDPIQSGSFQALQSYRFEDIHWETFAQFSPCLSIEKKTSSQGKDGIFSVDLNRYHAIVSDPYAEAVGMREADDGFIKAWLVSDTKVFGNNKPARNWLYHLKTLSSRISDSLFVEPSPVAHRKERSSMAQKAFEH